MIAHASKTTWTELCLRLHSACRIEIPPRCLLIATDEVQAAAAFLQARTELEEILHVATIDLEGARSLLRWYSVVLRYRFSSD
jgi:hypothetical protein